VLVILVRSLLAVLNSRTVVAQQIHVEHKEASNNKGQWNSQSIWGQNIVSNWVGYSWVDESDSDNREGGNKKEYRGNGSVEKHVQEILVVVETYAIRHPGTVVVHLKHATVALRTVVTTIGL